MAEAAMETLTVRGEGVSVDLLVWRRWRLRTPGLVERVLDINPGLAGLGPILPVGTVVRLPAETPAAPIAAPAIRLWD